MPKREGSAAAPTAGLHFTKELLKQIEEMGVTIAHVTLHVGLGTFRPVKVDDVTQEHHMHSEFYIVEEDQRQKNINAAKACRRPQSHLLWGRPPAAHWSLPQGKMVC